MVLALIGALIVASAFAHDEPRRAKVVKAPLITAYAPCTAPNTVTEGDIAIPACSPPVRSDVECGFEGPFFRSGYGRAAASGTPMGDFRLEYVARNLSPGCEGRRLCAAASLRVTTRRCVQSPCTYDLPFFRAGSVTACCIVHGGACDVSTTFNSEFLGVLKQGQQTGIEIVNTGLIRVDGPNLPAGYTFTAGVLAP